MTKKIINSKILIGKGVLHPEAISEIIIDTGWIKLDTRYGVEIEPVYIRRIGNVVSMMGSFEENAPSSEVVATLPAGFRPFQNIRLYSRGGFMLIRKNGNISFYDSHTFDAVWFS